MDKQEQSNKHKSTTTSMLPSVSSGQESDTPITSNASWKLQETKLMKELLYCFHGISGQFLTVKCQSYAKPPIFELAIKVHDESVRQKMLHMTVLGSMSKYLDDFIEQSCIDRVSLYRGTLASALRKQLSDYFRMLSQIECQLTKPDQMSLTRLRCEMHTAKRRLQWQVAAVHVHRHSIGCNVLSALYFLILNGSPLAFETLSPIFLQVSMIFYEQLKSWFYGNLIIDPNNEFFIVERTEANENFLIFQDSYYVNELNCPQFLTQAQGQMILSIGRTNSWLSTILEEKELAALKIYGGLDQVIKRVTTDAFDGVNAWGASGSMNLYRLELDTRVSRALTGALLKEGKLIAHLSALTGYLLFRQNGFAAQLISSVFDQSCQNVTTLELKEKFQHVISKTLTPDQEQIHPERTIELHFDDQLDGASYWDDFDVVYRVEKNDPMSLVLNERVLEKYYGFFKDTLQLKRIDWILCDILKSIKTTFRKIHPSSSHQLSPMNEIHLLGKEMLILAQQLLYTILSARLQSNWQTFVDSVKDAQSLEELEKEHEKYLDGIHSYIFPEQLHKLLQQTLELNDLYRSFRVAQEPFLCSSSDTATPSKIVVCPSSVPSRLRQLRKNFYELVAQFLEVLRSGPEEHMLHLYELINVNCFFEHN